MIGNYKKILLELYIANKYSFSQVIKSKKYKDLYAWFLEESSIISASSLRAKAYILLYQPILLCKYGNSKQFSQGKIRLCGKAGSCQCHTDNLKIVQSPFWKTLTEKEIFLKDRVKTWKENLLVDNPLKLEKNIIKQRRSLQNKNNDVIKRNKLNSGYNQVITRLANIVSPLFSQKEYFGCSIKYTYKWQCVICKHIFFNHVDFGTVPKCLKCYPLSTSTFEQEVQYFIRGLGLDIKSNTKTLIYPQELDIVIENSNVAIECNGIYWHSTQIKSNNNYHLNKFLATKSAGYTLLNICENNWKFRQVAVKNKLKAYLLPAPVLNNISVSIIQHIKAMEFYKLYEIQPNTNGSLHYGLYADKILYAIMSFKQLTHGNWSLSQYSSILSLESKVINLILNYFITRHDPNTIYLRNSRCWSLETLYLELGFTEITKYYKPGYFYTNRHGEYSKTFKAGYYKIYNCGNSIFSLTIT